MAGILLLATELTEFCLKTLLSSLADFPFLKFCKCFSALNVPLAKSPWIQKSPFISSFVPMSIYIHRSLLSKTVMHPETFEI